MLFSYIWLLSLSDLAVGAPYGGEDGRGAVYIYHGSMRGIITDVQQVGLFSDFILNHNYIPSHHSQISWNCCFFSSHKIT